MRRMIVLSAAVLIAALLASPSSAAVAAWDVSGTYTIVFTCTSGCGGDYSHTLNVTIVDTSVDPGTFTGNGFYQPNPGYTWDVTGTVSASDVAFHIVYTGLNAGYTVDAVGTIGADGSMSGTASSSASQTFTWLTTVGHAAPIPTTGSWSVYPEPADAYSVQVLPPIDPAGTSNWQGKRGVIPVQFGLFTQPGPVVLPSIGSDTETGNDFGYVAFFPTPDLLFSQLKSLKADYAFTMGNCHGGALRWQIGTAEGNLFIYYGDLPNFTDCTTNDQSGLNMIGQPDLRYDTSQLGGTFYDSYASALQLIGEEPIDYAALILDGGWGGDQVVEPTKLMVNDNVFEPPSAPPTRTCDLAQAEIKWTKQDPYPSGTVNESAESIQLKDTGIHYRIEDCRYIYNLDVATFGADVASRVGTYYVYVKLGGGLLEQPARFDLR